MFQIVAKRRTFSVRSAQPTNPVGRGEGGRKPAPNYVPSDGPSFFYRYEIGVFNGTNGTGYPRMTMFTSEKGGAYGRENVRVLREKIPGKDAKK